MKLVKRIRHFWRLSQIERELTEEIDHHRSISGDQAMGDIDQALREATAVWRWRWWDRLGHLRFALRWIVRKFWNRPDKALSFIEELGSLAFAAVLFGWRWLTGTQLTFRTGLLLGTLWVFLAMIQGFITGVARTLLGEKVKSKREFVKDPDGVLQLARLTGYESIRPFNRYRGKWMTVAGEFEGFTESFERNALHVSVRLEDGRRLVLRFDRDQREAFDPVRSGQRITAIGEIEQAYVQRAYFELQPQHCELVRVEPLRLTSRLTLAS